ncbi:glycosyltransferase [Amycolatopsis acidiphila]|uniref:Glycosyltransferase n=1 Tax=Amycolatopsis acidiphila TaxID=715473 RepID=A0A557ZN81_9PSEU|nr:glycosyltransferase [Amycolatopsis acidiphila]TVT13450.1 glycosyltransferase [Amycolatopsis acidiphila]UIJ63055.1 glycosyltransferase [Amycolatopsis acidiphila]GHG65881.1 hypothetical protein GCM10017788_23690 [Amycolatopsis acidiphila]
MAGEKRNRRLRLPWVFAGVAVAALGVMLVVAGLASAGIVSDNLAHEPEGADHVPTAVESGGPVVDVRSSPISARGMPDHTIALTFDDGPDPTWTPQVLSILHKYNVPGTFFVVGSRASTHPELVRRIYDSGSELGLHTFTHPELTDVSAWRMNRELDESQLAIAGATGATSYLFRLPYSSSNSAIDDATYRGVQTAAGRGYVSVFSDTDSKDFERPGVDQIVRNSTPADGTGAVLLMHDAGGDRAETVAALDRLIPSLQARGYHFTTVTGGLGLPPAYQPASASTRFLGKVLLTVVAVSLFVVDGLQLILFAVGLLVVLRLLLMVTVACVQARRRHRPGWRWGAPVTDPVSVIVPAYNELANIEITIRSILANGHPLEVIVVDDGSTDGTADFVEGLGLDRVRVIRQANGGKATALNTGIAHARHELIVMVDGDTMFEPDTVRRIVQPFADSGVGAVSGNVKIANRDTFLTRLQHIEYVVGFTIDRRVQDLLGSMCTIPGAAGAFRRRALLGVGGVSQETLAEDTDLTIALGRAGWRLVYVDDAVAWTEAPTKVRQLWQQRYRWTYGTMQSVWKHRRAIVQRGPAGRVGRFGLLHVVVFQLILPVTSPVIDIFFVYGLFFLNPGTTLVLWLSVMLAQALGAALAFRMDKEPAGPLWLMPAQQLVYRQLMYVVLGQSLVAAASGVLVRWQRTRRIGALDALLRPPKEPGRSRPRDAAPVVAARGGELPPVPSVATLTERARNRRRTRERWPALLAAVAVLGIVLASVTGWVWPGLVFPSLGVLFALGGSAMAKAMREHATIDAIGRGIRRSLPPLWLLGFVCVPVMLLSGWLTDADEPLDWPRLVLWLFPVADPPIDSWGLDARMALWFVRTTLWFILLTPLLMRALRRWPVPVVLAPLALVAADALAGSPARDLGAFGEAAVDLCVYGACWLLGLAHRQGRLARIHPVLVCVLSASAIALGVLWAAGKDQRDGLPDISATALGQALVCAGAVLVLLRLSPRLGWLDRAPLGRLVAVLEARVLTIVLWSAVATAVAAPVAARLGWLSQAGAALVLLVVALAAFGWVEDVAARRRPRLLPRAEWDPPAGSAEAAEVRPRVPTA